MQIAGFLVQQLNLYTWLVDFVFYDPLNSFCHMETEPRFKVSLERLEKPGIEAMSPQILGPVVQNFVSLTLSLSLQFVNYISTSKANTLLFFVVIFVFEILTKIFR